MKIIDMGELKREARRLTQGCLDRGNEIDPLEQIVSLVLGLEDFKKRMRLRSSEESKN